MKHKILVTGAAGFIGYHLCKKLCEIGYHVVGIDNLNDYYDVQLKRDRLSQLKNVQNFSFNSISITEKECLDDLFEKESFEYVVNLAAQAGVRYSIEKPYKYLDANLTGFLNILEACRKFPVSHLIFASSSSVYGSNKKIPFSESDHTDHPVSLYAATKKANEMMAHSYASLYDIPCTGLRFFTVYGPWGRPDMAYYGFTRAIIEGKPIKVFNNGLMSRDFTYIDDIVDGIISLVDIVPEVGLENETPDGSNSGRFALYNIGNNKPVRLIEFIEILEDALGKKAIKNMMSMQPGDVERTFADIDSLKAVSGYSPKTDLRSGLKNFVQWYRLYYGI
jgi:UDP-glucuronate 4-epimerase